MLSNVKGKIKDSRVRGAMIALLIRVEQEATAARAEVADVERGGWIFYSCNDAGVYDYTRRPTWSHAQQ